MYYFIVNPNSGGGKGYRIWRKLERQLKDTCVEYEAYFTTGHGDARDIARKLTEGCKEARIIIVAGGDGTINEVLDGLCFCAPLTLGYIPGGNGNDFARSLRLPKNPVRCLKKILYPKYHKLVDYGVLSYGEEEAKHRRFAVSAGIGFDAAVCHSILHGGSVIKEKGRKLRYLAVGLKQLIKAKPSKGYILLDGVQKVEFNHIFFISAHIHPYEGGGFRFAPGAKYDDGKLTLCVAHPSGRWKLLPILIDALVGKKKSRPGVRRFECREVTIHLDRPMPVHVDGESCLVQKDIEISCIQKKMRMIV